MGPYNSGDQHVVIVRAGREGVDGAAGRPADPHHDPDRLARLPAKGLQSRGHHPVVHRRNNSL